MIPSPPDSHPHSPAAALGSLGLLGIGDALKQLPPVPPLPLHLGGPPMAATIRSLSSLRSKGKSGALRHDSSSAGWQSCALTPDPSGDSIDVRPRSDQRQAFGSGSCSSSASSARESTASSPCEIRQEEGDSDESLLASPFLGPHDLMTPPFERSEEEGGIRRHRGLGVHLGQQPPSPVTLCEAFPRWSNDDGPKPLPLSPPTSDIPRQTSTQPPSPGTPATPFLRTVKSRTFLSMTTTTTASALGSHTHALKSPIPPVSTGYTAVPQSSDSVVRPRTVSTGVIDIGVGTSPQKRASRPASVRDWQSDDDEGLDVTLGRRLGASRRQDSRPAQTTASSPSSASHRNYALPPSSFGGSRQHKFKPARSAPDSRTNLAGMLSAALSLSPASAMASLSSSQDPNASALTLASGGDRDFGDAPSDPEGSASAVALASPLPALSKAITAPIAPLAHVLAFIIISLAAAVALSTVLVGSYGLTAWDVTRLCVRDARETFEDGRRRIGASVERGRRLIDGAVDGARGLAGSLVDSASAGLEDNENDDAGSAGLTKARSGKTDGTHVQSRTVSGQFSKSSTPHKNSPGRHRSTFVRNAMTSAHELVGQLTDSFCRTLKCVVPAAMVKRALEAAEIRLGRRPTSAQEAKVRRRQYDSGSTASLHDHDGTSHPRTASSVTATPGQPFPSPSAKGKSRLSFPATLTSSARGGVPTPEAGSPKLDSDDDQVWDDDDADDDSVGSRPPRTAPSGQRQRSSSALPPRPPLSVLIPSILLTLAIAFGATAYNLLRRRARVARPPPTSRQPPLR